MKLQDVGTWTELMCTRHQPVPWQWRRPVTSPSSILLIRWLITLFLTLTQIKEIIRKLISTVRPSSLVLFYRELTNKIGQHIVLLPLNSFLRFLYLSPSLKKCKINPCIKHIFVWPFRASSRCTTTRATSPQRTPGTVNVYAYTRQQNTLSPKNRVRGCI